MDRLTHHLDQQLLDNWQRGLPIVERPFKVLAQAVNASEDEIIARLVSLQESGVIARVGAVVRPNTLGASTLAAIAVPDLEIETTAELLSNEPGINHVYLRENDWNIWFVATGPDRASVDAALARVESQTNRKVLDLRLERAFHIDLGFALNGNGVNRHIAPNGGVSTVGFVPRDDDAQLVQQLMVGLPLVPRPFLELSYELERDEADVMQRIRDLESAGVLPRIGLIVRHRALGWRSNAMVVWDVPEKDVDAAGAALAKQDGINLCYRRRRYAQDWPFNLYCMIHAKSRASALAVLERASAAAGLDDLPRTILFSLRCFKQTGALVAPQPKEAA